MKIAGSVKISNSSINGEIEKSVNTPTAQKNRKYIHQVFYKLIFLLSHKEP